MLSIPAQDSAHPASAGTSHLPVDAALQLWVEREFPEEIHRTQTGIGYYAGSNSSELNARLYYYSGSSRPTVEAKLRIAAQRLEERGIRYSWHANAYGYKYLVVERYREAEPEPEAAPEPQDEQGLSDDPETIKAVTAALRAEMPAKPTPNRRQRIARVGGRVGPMS